MAINNKFARQTELNSPKRYSPGEEKISIDAQIIRLEEDIRRLKIEYDIYFSGAIKRAPFDTRNRVETMFKRLGDERTLTIAQRYQYNSLMARFNSFRELWRRVLKGREEGREAAATVPARSAQRAQAAPVEKTNSNFVCSDVGSEPTTVKQIYQALIQAKEVCGEDTNTFSFENFRRQLVAQTDNFKQKAGCAKVEFEVGSQNGRVFFKAKAGV